MWDLQVPVFAKQFHVFRYDMRGHGRSSVPPSPYSVADLAADALALADLLKLDRFHFCGLSIGGMIGMTIALQSSQRLNKLVLCSTAPKIGSPESWNTRIATVRSQGMPEIARTTPPRWFTPEFQSASPAIIASTMQHIAAMDPDGYIGGCSAVRDFDVLDTVSNIRVPTLVLNGTYDPATPPSQGHFLAQNIPGARYVELRGSHISNIEDAEHFNSAVLAFLNQ
jgi:3-oxoadipate enol-lactonase